MLTQGMYPKGEVSGMRKSLFLLRWLGWRVGQSFLSPVRTKALRLIVPQVMASKEREMSGTVLPTLGYPLCAGLCSVVSVFLLPVDLAQGLRLSFWFQTLLICDSSPGPEKQE